MQNPFLKIDRVIPIIIGANFVVTVAVSLLAPIFALFVTAEIHRGSAQVVGFALALYWGVKSILQLPIARYIDRNHGEYDDLYFMTGGMVFGALVLFGYYFATQPWHIYVLHGFFGLADAFVVPPLFAIFTRHIDKGNEGFEWSLQSSFSFGGGAAVGGALGGMLVAVMGYRYVFVLAAVLYLASAGIFWSLRPHIMSRVKPPVERLPVEVKRV